MKMNIDEKGRTKEKSTITFTLGYLSQLMRNDLVYYTSPGISNFILGSKDLDITSFFYKVQNPGSPK